MRQTSLHRHVKIEFNGEVCWENSWSFINESRQDLLLNSWTFLIDFLKMFAGDHICLTTAAFSEFEILTLKDQVRK